MDFATTTGPDLLQNCTVSFSYGTQIHLMHGIRDFTEGVVPRCCTFGCEGPSCFDEEFWEMDAGGVSRRLLFQLLLMVKRSQIHTGLKKICSSPTSSPACFHWAPDRFLLAAPFRPPLRAPPRIAFDLPPLPKLPRERLNDASDSFACLLEVAPGRHKYNPDTNTNTHRSFNAEFTICLIVYLPTGSANRS